MISNSEWVYHLNLGSREILSSGKVQRQPCMWRFTWSNSVTSAWEQVVFQEMTWSTPNNLKGRFIPNNLLRCAAGMSFETEFMSKYLALCACETGSTKDITFPDCHSILSKTSPNMSWWYQSTFPFIGPHEVETKMWGVAFLMASWPTRKGCDAGLTGPWWIFHNRTAINQWLRNKLTGSQLAPLQDSPTNASRTSYIKHGCRRKHTN